MFCRKCSLCSFVHAIAEVSLTLDVGQGLITGLVAGTVAVLVEARGWRLEVVWSMHHLVNAGAWISGGCGVSSPSMGWVPCCISGSFTYSIETISFVA